MSTWENINGDMFDFAKYYTKIANHLPAGSRIAEVGVADGKSAIFLAEALHSLGKKFEFYFIDNMAYGGPNQITEVVRNISKSGLGNMIELLPISSLDAAARFNNNFFDFVFLDSSHQYMQTKAEAPAWWNKVKDDCILAGHDYFEYKDDVARAIHELFPAKKIHITNGAGELDTFNSIEVHETEKGYGIWEIRKNGQAAPNIFY